MKVKREGRDRRKNRNQRGASSGSTDWGEGRNSSPSEDGKGKPSPGKGTDDMSEASSCSSKQRPDGQEGGDNDPQDSHSTHEESIETEINNETGVDFPIERSEEEEDYEKQQLNIEE